MVDPGRRGSYLIARADDLSYRRSLSGELEFVFGPFAGARTDDYPAVLGLSATLDWSPFGDSLSLTGGFGVSVDSGDRWQGMPIIGFGYRF